MKSRRLLVRVILGTALVVSSGLAVPAQASTLQVGFRDHDYSTSVSAPTGQKPQSKLWFADGRWWGVLWDSSVRRFTIHRFNLATQATTAWTSTGVVVDVRRNSQTDVLWDGGNQKLYVVSHLKDTDTSTADQGLKFVRFRYASGAYSLEVTHTVVNRKVEAAVLDKDSTGKLWVTYTEPNSSGGATVKVAHSTTSDTTWTTPFTLPVSSAAANASADDISTVVAYGDAGGRKIGVLWSNALTSTLYFASHVDGAADSAWTLTELCRSTLCPDDHLNIKSIDADKSGHLYAAVKTSLNDKSPRVPGDPLIVVYRLDPSGGWSSSVAWTVGEGDMTRAIVVLDSQNRRVHTFAAGPCCSGGTVYTKNASFDTLGFPRGNGTVFMRSATAGENINNPTSTKQTVNATSGLLVLAGIDSTRDYVHNYMSLGTPPGDSTAPTVTAVSPVAGASGVAVSANVSATFSEAMSAASVSGSTVSLQAAGGAAVPAAVSYDAAANRVTLDPDADLAAGASYTATVRGGTNGVKDVAGNPLATDRVWTFATAAGTPPPSGTQTVTLTVGEDSYVSSGAAGSNFGSSTLLGVDNSPVEISYLKFDLTPYAGRTVQSATLQLRSAGSGSTGRQNVKVVADDGWTESAITYTNRPALGATVLGSLGPTAQNTNYSVPLTATGITGDLGASLSLGIDSASSDGLDLNSGETANPPNLVLVLGGN